jgi:hypothetical protein
MRTRVVVLAALVLFALAPAAAKADVNFQVGGKWTCNNRGTVVPIAGARVELWREVSFWPDDKIGPAHTAADGSFNFNVRAGSNFDLYVKLVLNDDTGVSLGNWYSFSDWSTETSTTGSHSGKVNLGTWQISKDNGAGTPKCAIWQGAHGAYVDYKRVVGARPPDANYSISADFPCCGTPFTTTDTTRWPSGYQTGTRGDADGGFSVSFHEFAHSVRHSFDGGFLHFLGDVASYSYAQNHTACKTTNTGFAFNEGWAEYWARTPVTCGDGTNFNQEGNVATALTGLERCANRATMVRVLRENPGSIHSFAEFRTRFFAIVGPRACLISSISGNEAVENSLSTAQLTSGVQGQINAQKRLIAKLTARIRGAKRTARNPGRCTLARRCTDEVEKLLAPSALNAQIAQAKLVLGRLQDGLATARRVAFAPDFSRRGLYDSADADRRAFDRANQAIVIKGLKRGMRAVTSESGVGPLKANGAFRTLDGRLTLLTRARKRRADTPPSLESLFAAPEPPVDAVRRVRK